MDNNVPENLLCIICFEVPSHEVFQCSNAHILCGKCYPQLSACPQCDVSFGGQAIRNIFLEGVLNGMKVECPFREHGCNIRLFEDSLQTHVGSCIHNKSKFGPFISICKLIGHPHCPFSINHGNTSEAIEHFQKEHNCVIRDSDHFITELTNFVEMTHPNGEGESKMWVPLILNMRLYGFAVMILTIFCDKEKSISWIPLFMPYTQCESLSIQVKFCIHGRKRETGNDTRHLLKWNITPIDILNASIFLPNYYPHRIPTTPLVQNYTTPEGSLFIQAKIVRDNANAGSLAMSSNANLFVFTPLDVATFENANISPPMTPSAPPL